MDEAPLKPEEPPNAVFVSRADFLELTKFRLSFLVLVTTFVGWWLNRPVDWTGWQLAHTLIGSAFAAFGAAIFNQLMEIEPDSRMTRTASRPLPSRRVQPGVAFGLAWLLSSFAVVHLAQMVNLESALLCSLTILVYIFIYTPMKQWSTWNTIVGAVSGALPPLIGWAGAVGKGDGGFRWELVTSPGAVFLFLLLFVWQLPHFYAINWMYRDEYRRGGFVMLANTDENGLKTSIASLIVAALSVALVFYPWVEGCVSGGFVVAGLLVNAVLVSRSWDFFRQRDRSTARKLFLFTLLYLPLMLIACAIFWRRTTGVTP